MSAFKENEREGPAFPNSAAAPILIPTQNPNLFYHNNRGSTSVVMWGIFVEPQKYKNTRNNYSNILIVLDLLKSLLCVPPDIEVDDILNYRTNYLLLKFLEKAIANK